MGIYSINASSEIEIIAERFHFLVEHTEAISNGKSIHSTVSVGITTVRPEDTIHSLIERTDQLMYDSKHSGKNKVTYQ